MIKNFLRETKKNIDLEGISGEVLERSLKQSVHRANLITTISIVAFFCYGLTSYPFISHFDSSISLFSNLWPRFVFNSLPCFGLFFILRSKRLSDESKLLYWSIGFSTIFLAASMIHVWPLALKGYPIISKVTATNFISFAMIWWLLCLPFWRLLKIMSIHTVVYFIPLLMVTWLGGHEVTALNLIGELLFFDAFILLSGSYSTYILLKHQQSDFQIKQQMNNLLSELEKTNTFLNDSLSTNKQLFRTVIHDTASPLMIISESLKAMGHNIEAGSKKYLDKALKSAHSIISIVKEVRQLEFAQSNKRSLKLSPVKVSEVLNEVKFSNEDLLANKNISLFINNNLPEDTYCLSNKNILIYSVLNNLITNSIKFSKKGSVINLVASGAASEIVFEVRDHGMGIPRSIMNNIFDPSVPKSRIGTDGEVGSGFGMPLVKSYVDSFNGKIDIYSNSKESGRSSNLGTLVRVTLQAAKEGKNNLLSLRPSEEEEVINH